MKRVMLLMVVAALSILYSYPAYANRWVRCANEGEYCRFDGHRDIRYGAGDKWNHKSARDGISCNNSVFGDPAPRMEKACYYRNDPQQDEGWRPPSRDDGDRHARWIRCADEGEYCRFDGHRDIRYGAGDRWNHKSARNGISCNNSVFGDPAPRMEKACYYKNDPRQDEGWRPPSRHDADRHARWIRCANEREYCRFDGQRDIRYGAGDSWNYKSARNGISCGNDVFGDPAPGMGKACYYKD